AEPLLYHRKVGLPNRREVHLESDPYPYERNLVEEADPKVVLLVFAEAVAERGRRGDTVSAEGQTESEEDIPRISNDVLTTEPAGSSGEDQREFVIGKLQESP